MALNPYIQKEISDILGAPGNQDISPKQIALATSWIFAHYKGTQIKILDVRGLTSLTEFFVLVTVSNPTQAMAMADELTSQFRAYSLVNKVKEGNRETNWVLLDLNTVIAHIFVENAREIYSLDSLWVKAPTIPLPENFYFGEPEIQVTPDSEETDKYF